MLTRPRLLGLTLLTLAITACGGPTPPPATSLVPTGTITSGNTENGTFGAPLPTTVTITGTNLLGATWTLAAKAPARP